MYFKSKKSNQTSVRFAAAKVAVACSLVFVASGAFADNGNSNPNSVGTIELAVSFPECQIYIDSTKEISNIIFNLGTDTEVKIEDIGSNQYILGDFADGIAFDTINVKAGNIGTRGVGEPLDLTVPDEPRCETQPVYVVGGEGPRGGIVIETFNGGTSGWEVALTDAMLASGQMTYDWGCLGIDVAGIVNIDPASIDTNTLPADLESTGDANGEANTDEILDNCTTAGPTFTTTAALGAANYDEWSDMMGGGSLPNLLELYMIYEYDLSNGGVLGLTGERYWSSSEADADMSWLVNVDTGTIIPSTRTKTSLNKVRAISYF